MKIIYPFFKKKKKGWIQSKEYDSESREKSIGSGFSFPLLFSL